MDILQLTYFVEVAQTLNISKSAQKLYISQPALSSAISRLEADMGVKLFHRRSNSISLTQAGECFYRYARRALDTLDEGQTLARQIHTQNRNQLRVASTFTMIWDTAQEYGVDHPELNVEVEVCDTAAVLDRMHHLMADVGVLPLREENGGFDGITLLRSPYFAAVAVDDPLAQKPCVQLRDLSGRQLFCSNLVETYEEIAGIFRSADLKVKLIRLDEHDVLFDAARKGLGAVVCLPLICAENKLVREETSGITFLPISDCTCLGGISLILGKNKMLPPGGKQFVSFLEDKFHRIEDSTLGYVRARTEEGADFRTPSPGSGA